MFKTAAANLTTTANGAVSFKQTEDARVNLFFKACRGISKETLVTLLEESWKRDQLDTLKLIAYTRDIRGGKGEREIFRQMISWLAKKDPDSVITNIGLWSEYGRYDDLCVLFSKENEEITPKIINYFGSTLLNDLFNMNEGKPVSLLAKWFPSENKKLDKEYRIYTRVAEHMKISNRTLRKKYITPLREYIGIVETLLCQTRYSEIDFSKLPSYALKKYKKLFERKEGIKDLFEEFKAKLTAGDPNVKVNASVLFPHEIVREYLTSYYADKDDTILEAQWVSLMEKSKGLEDCLVLSDVSGSMNGVPMEVSIALGILISSKTKTEKFRNLVLTFETDPQFCHLPDTGSLRKRVNALRKAPWGGSTDFNKALKAILSVAVNNNLAESDMPKTLIVVSDMQFNSADRNYYTNHMVVKRMYERLGYTVPSIVYWNVNGSITDCPVSDSNETGVSLVSGFSKDILNCIISGVIPTPYTTMRTAIDTERYSKLVYLGLS